MGRSYHPPSSLRPPRRVGEERGDLPSPATQLSQRRDSPRLSAGSPVLRKPVPHHSRLVTNSFLSSRITYTAERKGRLFPRREVSPAPLAGQLRDSMERRVWEEKGAIVTGNEDVEGPCSWERTC